MFEKFQEQIVAIIGSMSLRLIVCSGSVFFASILYGVSAYLLGDDDLFFDIFSDDRKITFYSGGDNGMYHIIAGEVRTPDDCKKDSCIVEDQTNGGYENAVMVMTNKSAVGIIQEEVVQDSDYIHENIDFVTPLYLERLHILYNHERLKQIDACKDVELPVLKRNLGQCTSEFLEQAKFSTGPVGSGTRVISSYILSVIEQRNATLENQKVGMSEGFKRMSSKGSDSLDLYFTIAGAPLKEVARLLDEEDSDIRLMGIDPALIAHLNKSFNVNLRLADFKNKYSLSNKSWKTDQISTLGSYAILIASRDLSQGEKMDIVTAIDGKKESVWEEVEIENQTACDPDQKSAPSEKCILGPLHEIKFKNAYEQSFKSKGRTAIEKVAVLLLSILLAAAATFRVVLQLVSAFTYSSYSEEIRKIARYKRYSNSEITPESNMYISGIRDLIAIEHRFYRKYKRGYLSKSDYSSLLEEVTYLRDYTGERLTALGQIDGDIDLKKAREYLLSGYITSDQYRVFQESKLATSSV